ncbi:alpha/beta hydrolase [uncultured Shimia sp.]|uniref:alpha/beta fold hydrolase n=1 Tax=uncultured Shimia sp. TaxID=573152 RepID=UPI002627630E|nr:alpha/beta hydrolase [uncultured Shimia sp.]
MTPEIQKTPIGPFTATALRFPSNGAPVHFYHANGFGADCYTPFLTQVAPRCSLSALNMRPLWPDGPAPVPRRGWEQYGDDLIAWLEATQSEPVWAIGHSMGAATTAMAANKRPDLFRGLVLVEPAGVTYRLYRMFRLVPYRMRRRMDPAHSAFHRRSHWPTRTEALQEFRRVGAYKRFSDYDLKSLVEAVTVADNTGFRLAFPLDWEAHNYVMPPYILPTLKRLSVPTRIIAAKPSLFVDPSILKSLAKARPDIPITTLSEHGHLLPLEAPFPTADAVNAALDVLQSDANSATTHA